MQSPKIPNVGRYFGWPDNGLSDKPVIRNVVVLCAHAHFASLLALLCYLAQRLSSHGCGCTNLWVRLGRVKINVLEHLLTSELSKDDFATMYMTHDSYAT